MYSGIGVRWHRRCKTYQSVRELDNQGTVFFFFLAFTMLFIENYHIVRGGEPELRIRGMIASRSVNIVRHPRGNYIIPIAVSGVAAPEKKVTRWSLSSISKKVGIRCRSPSYERFLEGCS